MQIADIIAGSARRYGIDPRTMLRIGQIESGLRPNAQNPVSSAGGLFQFIDSTARQYGLTNKMDPVANADAAGRYLSDVRSHLVKALGREPTPGELYLGHQQGAGGASKLLTNPNALAANLVGHKAVLQNGGRQDMTAAEFASLWNRKMDGAGPAPTAAPGDNPVPPGSSAPGVPPELAGMFGVPVPVTASPDPALLAMQSVQRSFEQDDTEKRREADETMRRRQALFAPARGVAHLFG